MSTLRVALFMTAGQTKYVHGVYDSREDAIAEANAVLRKPTLMAGIFVFSICPVGEEEEQLHIEPMRVKK